MEFAVHVVARGAATEERPGAADRAAGADPGHERDRHRRRPGVSTPGLGALRATRRGGPENLAKSLDSAPGADLRLLVFPLVSGWLTATRLTIHCVPSARADRGRWTVVRVAVSEGGVPITRPTWFAEDGPLRRGWTRRGSGPPRQQPDLGSRSVSGWSEGSGPPRTSAKRCSHLGYLCHRAPADVPRAGGGRRAGAGLRAGRCRLPRARSRSPASCSRPVAWRRGTGLDPRARVRGRLLLRADLLDARGRHRRVDGPGRDRGALLRPAGLRHRRADPAAGLAALVRRRLGLDGGDPQLLAVQRHALGPAGLRHRGHPGRRRARVRRVDRGQLPARAARRAAGAAGRWPGGGAAGSRPVRSPRPASWRVRPGAGAVRAADGRPDDRGRRPGRRARQRRRHPATTSVRSPRTTSTPPSTSPRDVAAGRVPRPDVRGLAGELHGRRPLHRRPDRRGHPHGLERHRRTRSWSAPSSTPGRATCSTRASSGTRAPARPTGTRSGTRCPTASTSRSADSSTARTSAAWR